MQVAERFGVLDETSARGGLTRAQRPEPAARHPPEEKGDDQKLKRHQSKRLLEQDTDDPRRTSGVHGFVEVYGADWSRGLENTKCEKPVVVRGERAVRKNVVARDDDDGAVADRTPHYLR